MKRRKCQIIPVNEYDGMPPVAYEDNSHKYFQGQKGHYLKVTRKTCSEYAKTAIFVGIFKYRRHQRVERFCKEHAATFGPLFIIPEIKSKTYIGL
jgi:hypothetical protein